MTSKISACNLVNTASLIQRWNAVTQSSSYRVYSPAAAADAAATFRTTTSHTGTTLLRSQQRNFIHSTKQSSRTIKSYLSTMYSINDSHLQLRRYLFYPPSTSSTAVGQSRSMSDDSTGKSNDSMSSDDDDTYNRIPPPPSSSSFSSSPNSSSSQVRTPSRTNNRNTMGFTAGSILTGTVKFYLRDKGYGFIVADGRPDIDLFVHRGSVTCTHVLSEAITNATARYPYLKQGERVRFVLSNDMGTMKAVNVTWLNGDAIPPERKNYLGGVYERSHRLLGEACRAIMKDKIDIRTTFNESEYEKIRIAYIECKRSIEHAERILIELGMDVSQFPTIKGSISMRGKYLFQSEVEDANKKSIERAMAVANDVPQSSFSDFSMDSIIPDRNNTSETRLNNDPYQDVVDIGGSSIDTDDTNLISSSSSSSLFEKEAQQPSTDADVDDDIYSDDNAPYNKHR